jgi:hypothetical protein
MEISQDFGIAGGLTSLSILTGVCYFEEAFAISNDRPGLFVY